MLFGVTVGVSCRILYSIVSSLYVRCSVSIISVGEERANLSANLFTGSNVVSVRKGFLYVLVLGIRCVILWNSLGHIHINELCSNCDFNGNSNYTLFAIFRSSGWEFLSDDLVTYTR